MKSAAEFTGKRLVIFGGGDSALDWTLEFAGKARSVTLVHRRPEFRAAPASVAKMRDLVEHGSMRYVEAIAQSVISDDGEFRGVRVKKTDGQIEELAADHVLVFFGLHPKLGPIARMGPGDRQARDQRRHRKIPDQHSGRVRRRRHQHLSGQEEADPVGLSRSGAGGVRGGGAPESRRRRSRCSTRPPVRSCTSGWASPD